MSDLAQKARVTVTTPEGELACFSLYALQEAGLCQVESLPYSIRVLLESLLRHAGRGLVTEADVASLAGWKPGALPKGEVPFMPARVIMQDFTGVPAVVDLAAMRGAMRVLGGDPAKINPLIQTDLVIDHSVQVDAYGTPGALDENERLEFQRNQERYAFLRWGQKAFKNFSIFPPSTGIVHQVNLEHLAQVVNVRPMEGEKLPVALPDSVLGTDSHTTMINGLGVLGWGVGGIEAEAAMLGQPYYMLAPEVVGVELTGQLKEGILATDLVLHLTQMLRAEGVVGKFVEFFGPGMAYLSLADRATLANMAPEYGATMGFFPVDGVTLDYLRLTGRKPERIATVETVLKKVGLFAQPGAATPAFTKRLSLDMSQVVANLAGPKRPQDRVALDDMAPAFAASLAAPTAQRGFGLSPQEIAKTVQIDTPEGAKTLGQGAVVIAAITSCTNTSNPSVLVAAGLLAKKAVEKGLARQPWVKTSLAPGSRVVTDYLERAGLLAPLAQLGFHVVGYGCTTCIGNSGPLDGFVAGPVKESGLVAASVLSGNRNFEGRVNPLVKANYLASPPLVVAYALAGTVTANLSSQPIGTGKDGQPVYLKDIWPTSQEVERAVAAAVRPEQFAQRYGNAMEGPAAWRAIQVPMEQIYQWDAASTYIQEPPYFDGMAKNPAARPPLKGMRLLALLGDSVTTDHISPAGSILADGPAGRYLQEHGVKPVDFNSFGSRRGNDRVMTRGTFANIRLKNLLAPGTEGGVTRHLPTGETLSIFDAAERYKAAGTPLLIIGGKEYGTGSSRDWAAKGTQLLGVRAVLAESFERIHRSNLIGMGVLPLQFLEGQTPASLGLTGEESFDLAEDPAQMAPGAQLTLTASLPGKAPVTIAVRSRIDTQVEVGYYKQGGIMQAVLRQLL